MHWNDKNCASAGWVGSYLQRQKKPNRIAEMSLTILIKMGMGHSTIKIRQRPFPYRSILKHDKISLMKTSASTYVYN